MLRTYYYLAKPGIIRGNAITAAAGALLAFGWEVQWGLFFAALAGLSLIVAAGCVYNNVLDREIDRAMERTHHRALVVGKVTVRQALILATVLALSGSLIMAVYTNPVALATALFGLFAYVVVYGYAKRRSPWGTVVGSVSGAIPPVVGYVAVTGRLDQAAVILFAILVTWQMPHFYAIAIFRLDDYRAAKLPVLPAVRTVAVTKRRILGYVAAFTAVAPQLSVYGYTGQIYFWVAIILGSSWLILGLRGLQTTNDIRWARTMFGFSLFVLTVLSALIASAAFLP